MRVRGFDGVKLVGLQEGQAFLSGSILLPRQSLQVLFTGFHLFGLSRKFVK